MTARWIAIIVLLSVCRTGTAADDAEIQAIPPRYQALFPLHQKMGKPLPDDWLATHKEAGQTYLQYVRSKPVRADKERRVLAILPFGEFTESQTKIADRTAEFMGDWFGLEMRKKKPIASNLVPSKARRLQPDTKNDQANVVYLLNEVVRPRLPDDAVAMLALTNFDLWPGNDVKFVFGQAAYRSRVGAWSMARFGNPDAGEHSYRLCLRRTIQVAVHETGHMFSMMHCPFYQCNMNGSNHLGEADRQPLALCPVCLAKLHYATGVDPETRFEKLAAFFEEEGFEAEQAFCKKSLAAWRAAVSATNAKPRPGR